MNQEALKVRVVLPTYNEASRIAGSIDLINAWLSQGNFGNIKFEWLWVNDGSRDNTLEVLRKEIPRLKNSRMLSYEQNQGKGFACRMGILDEATQPDLIFFTDADLAIPLKHLFEMAVLFRDTPEKIDLILGVRNPGESTVHESRRRNMMTFVFRAWVRFRLGLPFTDTQCGFKGFRADSGKKLFRNLRRHRFTFDLEVLMRSHLLGMKFLEIPVGCNNKGMSSVRMYRDSLKMLFDIETLVRERQEFGNSKF